MKETDKIWHTSLQFLSLYIEILHFINGLVQDWSISIANALEILKSCHRYTLNILQSD